MARYFFHVRNSDLLTDQAGEDELGQQFFSLEEAKAHAAVIAKEIQDDDWHGYAVVVVDEQGAETTRVPIEAETGGHRS